MARTIFWIFFEDWACCSIKEHFKKRRDFQKIEFDPRSFSIYGTNSLLNLHGRLDLLVFKRAFDKRRLSKRQFHKIEFDPRSFLLYGTSNLLNLHWRLDLLGFKKAFDKRRLSKRQFHKIEFDPRSIFWGRFSFERPSENGAFSLEENIWKKGFFERQYRKYHLTFDPDLLSLKAKIYWSPLKNGPAGLL